MSLLGHLVRNTDRSRKMERAKRVARVEAKNGAERESDTPSLRD